MRGLPRCSTTVLVDPPGNTSAVGAITSTPGASDPRIGSSNGGQSWLPFASESARDRLLSSAYSPSPSGTSAARRPVPRGRAPASRGLVEAPESELRIQGHRPVDSQALGGAGHRVRGLGEGKARGVDPISPGRRRDSARSTRAGRGACGSS